MKEIRIETCRPEDAGRLTEIAHASKRYWGYPESWIEAWRESLTVDPTMIERHVVRGVRVDGRLAGFYVLIRVGRRAELDHFWLLPEQIGHGAGRAMFDDAVAVCRDMGVVLIDITSDPNAEPFYARMGARRVGWVPAPVLGQARSLPRMELEIPTCPAMPSA